MITFLVTLFLIFFFLAFGLMIGSMVSIVIAHAVGLRLFSIIMRVYFRLRRNPDDVTYI